MAVKDAGYAQLTSAQCETFAIRTLRADFLAQSEAKRRTTLDRVRRLLEAEQARKQNQPSWLARHAREVYGL